MKHELLAPAGNLEVFYAVVNAGADAVYIGGPKYGARAYAKNFTQEDILTAISYAHLHQVKVYMTVNTLVKNEEMDDCVRMMIPFYEAGLDGVIIQDIGILRRFRKEFPEMELHISTQMSISNVEGAKLMKQLGASRVVTSRELSLKEIQRIHQEADVEIESFIHGALCYCYSGQCLLSSVIGGRSGNRGRCAQPCRLPYEVYSKELKKIRNSSEILSLKDLCTIEFLPELLKAGIYSLKIEGRMKQASYAYTVVSIYRKYLDLYDKVGDEGYKVSKEDYQTLLDAGNRNGFTKGYYHQHNGPDMITGNGAAHTNGLQYDENEICQKKQVPILGKMVLRENEPMTLTLRYLDNEVTVNGEMVQVAHKQPMTVEQVEKQLNKTGNSYFFFQQLTTEIGEKAFAPVSAINQLRRQGFELLLEGLSTRRNYLEKENAKEEFLKEEFLKEEFLKEESLKENKLHGASVSIMTVEQAKTIWDKEYITRIYVELSAFLKDELLELCQMIKEHGKQVYINLPYVIRMKGQKRVEEILDILYSKNLIDGLCVRSYDGVNDGKSRNLPMIADQSIYTYSNESQRMAKEMGIDEMTVPYELKEVEIRHRENEQSEMLVYGRIPVMITSNCIHKNVLGCDSKSQWTWLKDRKGFQFPVKNVCDFCYNVIYNSAPNCLFQKQNSMEEIPVGHRICFTIETKEQVEDVMKLYEKQVLKHKNDVKPLQEFTWGHFNRGVE